MATYKTHQKEMVINFLSAHPDTQFTAEEIAENLRRNYPDAPGKSTVYRLISKLADDGTLKRTVKENSRRFLFQATNEACHGHLHLKCTECGKVLHMGHSLSEQLINDILGENDFSVQTDSTTLFGCCKECKEKDGQKNA